MKLDDLTTADQLAGFLSKVRMSKLRTPILREEILPEVGKFSYSGISELTLA